MSKASLPSWIKGRDRQILTDFISGVKPARILAEYGLIHSQLVSLRRRYGVPSQVVLRRTPEVEFGPPRRSLDEITNYRQSRLKKAVGEYTKSEERPGIVKLARKYHLPTQLLSNTLREHGFIISQGRRAGSTRPKAPSSRDLAIINAVVNHGRCLAHVAREQKPPISRERVRQILAKAGYRRCGSTYERTCETGDSC